MENDPIDNPPYNLALVFPSRGAAAVMRNGPALLIDFYGLDTSTAVRIAVHAEDAHRTLAELQALCQ